jgi:Zn-dependent protease/CBS domain-containing protein
MSWSIKLIRIRGIDIKVHLTFVLILIWAAYRWGVGLRAGTQGALFGITVILLLFACVTLHELAHSLTAIHYGAKVKDITLLPIGGISQMEKMPEKPSEEFKVSVIGPLTNIVIAALLFFAALPFRAGGGLGTQPLGKILESADWSNLLPYLVLSNVVLGIFNLLPAFPMDGGRVLRSLLAMRMDYLKATAWAVNIGQGMAWLLGLYGFIGGSWIMVIIAIFIYIGAGQEGRMVEIKGVLAGLRVRQAMSPSPQTLAPGDSLSHAADAILHSFQSDFPVIEGDRLVGFLTERDLVPALKKFGPEAAVKMAMLQTFPTTTPDEPLFEAQQRMVRARLVSLPVLTKDKLVGLLTAHDINEAYLFVSVSPHLLTRERRASS